MLTKDINVEPRDLELADTEEVLRRHLPAGAIVHGWEFLGRRAAFGIAIHHYRVKYEMPPADAPVPAAPASPDANVEAVRDHLLRRSEVGLAKYGVTTQRKDLTLAEWCQHAQDEALDHAVYLQVIQAKVAEMEDALRRVRANLRSINAVSERGTTAATQSFMGLATIEAVLPDAPAAAPPMSGA